MAYFHVGRRIIVLFRSWTADDTQDLVFYLVLVFALALLYECLRGFQKYFLFKLLMPVKRPVTSQIQKDIVLRKRLIRHLISTSIYMTQMAFGYFLMLLIMTYNSLIFATVMIGIVIGFYLSEPLIVRGLETLYFARIARRSQQDQRNAQGRLLPGKFDSIEDIS